MVQPLVAVLVSLVAAYVLAEIFKKLGLPRVIGQIGAGLLLSVSVIKSYLFSYEGLETLSFLANLGIILLFFYVGLEINLLTFKKNLKMSIFVSVMNTSLPLVAGFLTMYFLMNLGLIPSLIVALSLSVSSQSIAIDLLEELKLLKSKIASLIINAGTVDDIIELFIVTLLLSVFQITTTSIPLLRVAIDVLVFLGIILIARTWFIPTTLKFFSNEKNSTSRFAAALIIVLVIASLAEFLGVGLLIGALIAGMIVRQTILRDVGRPDWEEYDIARSVHIVAFAFFIPLFFVWTGLNVDLTVVPKQLGFIGLLVAIALIGTILGTVAAIWMMTGKIREGFIVGWGLSSKGDIELVLAAVALKAGVITQSLFTALVMMSLATMIIAPLFLKNLAPKH